MTEDTRVADNLDHFLDALVQGRAPHRSAFDNELMRFARRVQTTIIAPPPRSAFRRFLRQSLLTETQIAPGQNQSLASAVARWSHPAPTTPPARWRPALEFAAMVLLIVTIAGGFLAGDRIWARFTRQDEPPRFAAQDTTPSLQFPADNAPCETPPRTVDEIADLAATPVADPYDPIADSGGTRAETEDVHGVIRTLEQIQTCASAGDLLAVYANFSDRFIRRHLSPVAGAVANPAAVQEAIADPPVIRWPPDGDLVSIDDLVQPRGKLVLVDPNASLLSDGRVRAIVGIWRPTNEYLGRYVALFVRDGDRWLIDEAFETEQFVFVDEPYADAGAFHEGDIVVAAERTTLHGAPGAEDWVVVTVPPDTRLAIWGDWQIVDGEVWWPVTELTGGRRGYVRASAIDPAPTPPVGTSTPTLHTD